ncbi:hypothetical protein RRSWK_01166 [Rhodopirellula sp. SWK7]|nr:hypothetical protein RRSWK_01166 [Rhodopirellula sp. SWK7]
MGEQREGFVSTWFFLRERKLVCGGLKVRQRAFAAVLFVAVCLVTKRPSVGVSEVLPRKLKNISETPPIP